MRPRLLAPMKFVQPRPFADPDLAARKLVEIANGVEAGGGGCRAAPASEFAWGCFFAPHVGARSQAFSP
jgi:hypothetical protein